MGHHWLKYNPYLCDGQEICKYCFLIRSNKISEEGRDYYDFTPNIGKKLLRLKKSPKCIPLVTHFKMTLLIPSTAIINLRMFLGNNAGCEVISTEYVNNVRPEKADE